MTHRYPCLVPGCRRTTGKECDEFICGKHWPTVPRQLRTRYHKAKRQFAKHQRWANWKAVELLWLQCKEHAINEALGIGNG